MEEVKLNAEDMIESSKIGNGIDLAQEMRVKGSGVIGQIIGLGPEMISIGA